MVIKSFHIRIDYFEQKKKVVVMLIAIISVFSPFNFIKHKHPLLQFHPCKIFDWSLMKVQESGFLIDHNSCDFRYGQ